MTQETYEFLTKAHGIARYVCLHCWKRPIEVYQADWEGCYICWCEHCHPKIDPYKE